MNFISTNELHSLIQSSDSLQLVDVRESYEFEDKNIGGINIPLGEILNRKDELSIEGTVVLCCKSGKRSAAMAHTLERKYQLSNIRTLEGGLEKYFEEYA